MTAGKHAHNVSWYSNMQALTLKQYIDEHHNGNQARFAAANNVKPPQVTQWIDKEFIVVGNELYSKRRDLISVVDL